MRQSDYCLASVSEPELIKSYCLDSKHVGLSSYMAIPVDHLSIGVLRMEDIRKFLRVPKGPFDSPCFLQRGWAVSRLLLIFFSLVALSVKIFSSVFSQVTFGSTCLIQADLTEDLCC